jgi:hypothetical protein
MREKAICSEHLELIEKLELFDDLCKKVFPFLIEALSLHQDLSFSNFFPLKALIVRSFYKLESYFGGYKIYQIAEYFSSIRTI